MKNNLSKLFLFVLACSALFTSCIEDPYDAMGDKGKSMVKIMEAPEKQLYFSPFTDNRKVDLFSVRKDAASKSDLNTPTTVQLVSSPAMIEAYNKAHKENYEQLPADAFTVANPAYQKTATGYTVNFADGEFANDFTIMLNGSKWTDLSKKYAVGFVITDAPGLSLASGRDSVLVFLSIKNKYDGNYEVEATAPMVDVVNAALTGFYPLDSDLHTVGPNSVVMFCYTYLGGYQGHPIKNGTASSYYGDFAPVFTMDEDGNVVSVTNYWGQPAGNGRSAKLNPDGVNKFTIRADGSKVLEVSYIMVQAGSNRTFFHEKWTYKKER